MQFKGPIASGEIRVEFLADFSNEDPDLLIVGYASIGGAVVIRERAEAAPGGQAKAELELDESGTLEVIVATGRPADSGRLRVSVDDVIRDDLPILGSAHWVYSVEGEL